MSHIKRITPLRIVDDIAEASLFYKAIGATRVETDTAECVGFKAANDTHVILSSFKNTVKLFGPFVAQKLLDQGALYLYVDNIDAHLAKTPAPTHLLACNIVGGVEEAVVETNDGLVVLAHKLEMAEA